jgi:uncharacterized protein (TIGR00255 family)
MKSMTGFGRSSNRTTSASKQKGRSSLSRELDISIKSVNGRYCDLRFHLPREYAGLESEFKKLLGEVFKRGTFDIYINRTSVTSAPAIRLNHALAKSWNDSYLELARTLKIKAVPSLELLSRIPEIFQLDTESDISSEERVAVTKLLLEAAENCDRERTREGKALALELSSMCARLQELVLEAESIKAEAATELEQRLSSRLNERLQEFSKKPGAELILDEQRVAQEVVMYLDRADISEELTRLREHLNAYEKLLKSRETQGKKLDFYAQELLREINTIGSKSHIARLTALVVEAKTVVERIREQVQNVE